MSSNSHIQNSSFSSFQSIISEMKTAETFNARLSVTKDLNKITNSSKLEEISKSEIINILSEWINNYREQITSGNSLTPDEEDIIINIVSLCDKCNLKVNVLKKSKIAKNLNKLGKVLNSSNKSKKPCENLVKKWRKDAENKEENLTNEVLNKKTNRDNNNNFLSSSETNNNNNIKNSINNNLINPNKKYEPNLILNNFLFLNNFCIKIYFFLFQKYIYKNNYLKIKIIIHINILKKKIIFLLFSFLHKHSLIFY
jgi:hypothetical protein